MLNDYMNVRDRFCVYKVDDIVLETGDHIRHWRLISRDIFYCINIETGNTFSVNSQIFDNLQGWGFFIDFANPSKNCLKFLRLLNKKLDINMTSFIMRLWYEQEYRIGITIVGNKLKIRGADFVDLTLSDDELLKLNNFLIKSKMVEKDGVGYV